jgi:hypothetical protein
MEILLQDLLPGQEYLIQLRSRNQNGVSQWSRAYSFSTTSDTTAPSSPTGLSWNVSGTSFIGEWIAPTTDSNGNELKDFKDFKVTLTADSADVVFYVTEPRFELSLSRNIAIWGSPKPEVAIKVETRDNVGNLSSAVSDSATNSIPSDVAGFDSSAALGGVNLVWNHVPDNDLKHYEIYVGGSSGFIPSPANLKVVTTSNSTFYATDIFTLQYFKIRAVDAFNQGSENYAVESQSAYPLDGIPDTEAPSQPSAPVVSIGTLVAQISHDMTKQSGGYLEPDVDYLEIHASTSSGFTPSESTLRGTINSAGAEIPVSAAFFFPSTDDMTNLYWKVVAVDRSKNRSLSSNQATGLPNLIESANILDATITNAKIQDLSAAKLIAGTAIVNDIYIESNLTVSNDGIIESENFSTGVSGWQIAADGSVEFNDGLFRGDIEVTNVYDTKEFSVEVGNMDSNFIWNNKVSMDGQEPTLLFRGWSFKENGLGGFDPVNEIQSIVRLTPLGEFQILFDPSHTTDVLSIDGANRRGADGEYKSRYYGWVDKRMGPGIENDVSYASDIQGRDPFGNSYYSDEIATSRSIASMGSESENNARIQSYAAADGAKMTYDPRSYIRLRADSQDTYVSRNIIQDGMDLFDNGGGVAYYSSNTTRNRITLNSIISNAQFVYGTPTGDEKLRTAVDATLTSAGAGNHSIAFTSGSTTYPISVTSGDEYYMSFYGYKPSGQALSYRFFMKTDTGVTIYSSTKTFDSTTTNTILKKNSNYSSSLNDFLIVPSGATSAHFGIEFIGTVSSDQNLRLSGIQVIKVFSNDGTRQLASNFRQDSFYAVDDQYSTLGAAQLVINTSANSVLRTGTTKTKAQRNSSFVFTTADQDDAPGTLGLQVNTITFNPLGLRVGSYGEPRSPHGEARNLQSIGIGQHALGKLTFDNTKTLNTIDGLTMNSQWIEMGVAIDNTPGYTTFIPQRAGIYLVSAFLSWDVATGSSEYHVVELIKDSAGSYLGVHRVGPQQVRTTANFVTPLSAGEKVFVQAYHDAAVTRTYDTNSYVNFVQLI